MAAAASRTVVVLETAGPVLMPWLEEVDAVVAAWYGGQGGAAAIAGVLSGEINPSGRLPLTFPRGETQLPRLRMTDPLLTTSSPGVARGGEYLSIDYDTEGDDVGCRWFEQEHLSPLFSFGRGLSCTAFRYTGIVVEIDDDGFPAVELTVTSTGDRAGIDTPQIYMAPPEVPDTSSARRLAGWARVELEPGGSRRVRIVLGEQRVCASYDPSRTPSRRPVAASSSATARSLVLERVLASTSTTKAC